MNSQLTEELTMQFYSWERRGRGWDVWSDTVQLEPPFVPFYHFIPEISEDIDDGRKPTILSSIVENVKGLFIDSPIKTVSTQAELNDYYDNTETVIYKNNQEITEIRFLIPQDIKINMEYFEQYLLTISSGRTPISFEIVGYKNKIFVQFSCPHSEVAYVSQQIKAYFPEAYISTAENSFHSLLSFVPNEAIAIVDFGLSEEFMRPIKTYDLFSPDSLTSIFGVLENLAEDEIGILQILFSPAESSWSNSIMRSVTNYNGSSFFADAPEMIKLSLNKCNSPLYATVVRIISVGTTENQSWELARQLSWCMGVFSDPNSNEFIPLTNENYNRDSHIMDVIKRETHRSGMLLNSAELVSLVHFPANTIISSKLWGNTQKSRELPVTVRGNDYILGINTHNGRSQPASLSQEQRFRHTHIIGATGTGKSTLLQNLILQDIEKGIGIAVLDPHGDLIESILEMIPASRQEDIIIFDPSDENYPIGFNILEAKSDIEKNVLSSDLVEIFHRFSTSWGDQMSVVLGNAISAFLENTQRGSLVDLRRFLIEKEFRNSINNTVTDEHIVYFWQKEYPLLKGSALSSILTRLNSFLRPKLIRNIVSQKAGLDLSEVIDTKKILLVKLSQGIIGDENAYLLGSLLVSKLHQVIMQRQIQASQERSPFFLYIDEFQNFITPSLKSILSGARKYHLGLILAHQDLHQLWENDPGLANSIISNAGTRICFRVGEYDAQKLQNGYVHFDINDLQNLSVGEAIVRVERSDYDFNICTILNESAENGTQKTNKQDLINLSRSKYCKKIEEKLTIQTEREVFSVENLEIKDEIKKERPFSSIRKEPIVKSERPEVKKGNTYHRYLQTLIKRLAEQRGYKAIIEESTSDKMGRVDVGLEKEGIRIACEVSVTTNGEHEIKNIEKCLNSGYDMVLFCSPERKRLEVLQKLLSEKLESDTFNRVSFFLPDELVAFFETECKEEIPVANENVVKGYRVKVQYTTISEIQKKDKRNMVNGIVVKALRRIKG